MINLTDYNSCNKSTQFGMVTESNNEILTFLVKEQKITSVITFYHEDLKA